MKKHAAIITLGCRVNQYESECIAEMLRERGFEICSADRCDIAIVNTCTVTGESDRKSRQMIRRAVRESGKPVIVTGCYCETSGQSAHGIGFSNYPDGLIAVVSNKNKHMIAPLADALVSGGSRQWSFIDAASEPVFDGFAKKSAGRARSYIKIEDGCDSRCAYCIIPKARGAVRSKPRSLVLDEAERIAAAGCREIILTGIEVAAYGRDLADGYSLCELIRDIDRIDGIERIAVGSLDPTVFRGDFAERLSQIKSVLPHFHLSLQSGCTATLLRMCRRYTAEMAEEYIGNIRRAFGEVMLSADVIVGFPGELDADFEECLEFFRRERFLHLHIFPYSKRAGTRAASMSGQISEEVKKERVLALSAVQERVRASILDEYVARHSSDTVRLLVEEIKNGSARGHSEHYVEVEVAGELEVGGIYDVSLCSHDRTVCRGEIKEK